MKCKHKKSCGLHPCNLDECPEFEEKIKKTHKQSILIKQIQQLQGVENALMLAISPESNDFMVVEIYFSPESVVDRLTPEELALRNYEATVKRGLINDETTVYDFVCKLHEESEELYESWIDNSKLSFDHSGLADISLVCDAISIHYGINLQSEKEKKMKVNETRLD